MSNENVNLSKVLCVISLFLMSYNGQAQRDLMSVYNTEIYNGEDIYSAGIYNSWTGTYQINLPKLEQVERILVEVAYEAETDKLPNQKVRFSTNNDDVLVRLPKREYHPTAKKNFFVYRANLNSSADFAKIMADEKIAPIYFKIIVFRSKEAKEVVSTL